MHFETTKLDGVWLVRQQRMGDERGHFARTFCKDEFSKHGLATDFVQASAAFTAQTGTVRGLHFQLEPHWETKLVRCTRGAAFVVAVDLRRESPNHRKWVGIELDADEGTAIYVPEGFAQGYQTLIDKTELSYQMTTRYRPELASGYAFDDPAFEIEWPLPARNLSQRDQSWARYSV